MNKSTIKLCSIFCKQSGCMCIYFLRQICFNFCLINCCVSSTIDDKFRLFFFKKVADLIFICDIECVGIGKKKLVFRILFRQNLQFIPQLSVCTSYKYFHFSKIKFISASDIIGAAKSFSETMGCVSPSIQSIFNSGSFRFTARSASFL